MKNVMTANVQEKGRYAPDKTETILKAQVENSIEVGWEPEDIIVVTNFPFEFMGVKAHEAELNKTCLTGSKMFAVQWLYDNGLADDVMWCHDLDAWQNVWFDAPKMKDVGICTYSKPTLNGGSVFWSMQARGLVNHIVDRIKEGQQKEEPTINKILSNHPYKDRVTILNSTYNVGCSGFVKRATRATKPIRVAHFNPTNRIAWDTHALDRNKVGIKSVSYRLENLVRRYYPWLT